MKKRIALLLIVCGMIGACATKHLPVPDPIVGVDIAEVTAGQQVPFNGTIFSPRYLNEYLQWDCKDEGKC